MNTDTADWGWIEADYFGSDGRWHSHDEDKDDND